MPHLHIHTLMAEAFLRYFMLSHSRTKRTSHQEQFGVQHVNKQLETTRSNHLSHCPPIFPPGYVCLNQPISPPSLMTSVQVVQKSKSAFITSKCASPDLCFVFVNTAELCTVGQHCSLIPAAKTSHACLINKMSSFKLKLLWPRGCTQSRHILLWK